MIETLDESEIKYVLSSIKERLLFQDFVSEHNIFQLYERSSEYGYTKFDFTLFSGKTKIISEIKVRTSGYTYENLFKSGAYVDFDKVSFLLNESANSDSDYYGYAPYIIVFLKTSVKINSEAKVCFWCLTDDDIINIKPVLKSVTMNQAGDKHKGKKLQMILPLSKADVYTFKIKTDYLKESKIIFKYLYPKNRIGIYSTDEQK